MRHLLKDPQDVLVEKVIKEDLENNDKLQLERKFQECSICNRKIVQELLPLHISMCEKRKLMHYGPVKISLETTNNIVVDNNNKQSILSATATTTTANHNIDHSDLVDTKLYERPVVYDIDASIVTSLATFLPQPPRNCKVIAKGCHIYSYNLLTTTLLYYI